MRLRFSRATDYGLRAALEVAQAPRGTLVTRHAIARATDAPASVLAQSLAGLVRAGILDGQAGPHGGYSLARPAHDVTVYDVVTAIDPNDHGQRCVLREGACSWEGACPFHEFLAQAQERFIETLRGHTLAEVLAAAGPALSAPQPAT
jgi:Rrf2 family iron-sulfur cluster assembly transcriptional regulator